MSLPIKHLIEFDFPSITDLSTRIWNSIKNNTESEFGSIQASHYTEMLKLRYTNFKLNDTTTSTAKGLFPFFNGNIVFLIYEPRGFNPPHMDGLSTDTKLFEYNFLVPIENPEGTTTVYLKDRPMEDNVPVRTRYPVGLIDTPESDYEIEFTHTITKPCMFYQQKLHAAKNLSDNTRVAAAWKMNKGSSIDDMLTWADDNYIKTEVRF